MRPDMFEVLTERARCGSKDNVTSRIRAKTKQTEVDDLPAFEGRGRAVGSIVGCWSRRDGGSINSNILERFLNSNVGRPWDKVFSEFSEHIKITSRRWTEREIFKRFEWILHESVMLAVPDKNGSNIWDLRRGYYLSNGDLYIHPKTGILLRVKQKRQNTLPKLPDLPRMISAWQILIQRDLNKEDSDRRDRQVRQNRRPEEEEEEPNLVWYLVDLAPIPGFSSLWHIQQFGWPEEARNLHDVFFGSLQNSDISSLERLYKKLGVYGKRKKQLNRREMKRYGVWRQK